MKGNLKFNKLVKRVEFILTFFMFSQRQILNILPESTSKQKKTNNTV